MTINSVKSYFPLIASDILPPKELDHSNSKNQASYTLFIFHRTVCICTLLFNMTNLHKNIFLQPCLILTGYHL